MVSEQHRAGRRRALVTTVVAALTLAAAGAVDHPGPAAVWTIEILPMASGQRP
jgi:hypothetical protein